MQVHDFSGAQTSSARCLPLHSPWFVHWLTKLAAMTAESLRTRTQELWGEHNSGLDTSAMEVVAQVKRISALLDLSVDPIYRGAELTAAEVELMVPLRYAEEPMAAIRLAERLGMSRAGVSKALAKLERGTHCTRTESVRPPLRPDKDDRRGRSSDRLCVPTRTRRSYKAACRPRRLSKQGVGCTRLPS